MSKYSLNDIIGSVEKDDHPPSDFSPELSALWYTKKGNWDKAHDIVSEINTSMASWIHAHLHVIEGDLGMPHIGITDLREILFRQISWIRSGFFWWSRTCKEFYLL